MLTAAVRHVQGALAIAQGYNQEGRARRRARTSAVLTCARYECDALVAQLSTSGEMYAKVPTIVFASEELTRFCAPEANHCLEHTGKSRWRSQAHRRQQKTSTVVSYFSKPLPLKYTHPPIHTRKPLTKTICFYQNYRNCRPDSQRTPCYWMETRGITMQMQLLPELGKPKTPWSSGQACSSQPLHVLPGAQYPASPWSSRSHRS
jgi:hypothetical protein